MSVNLQEHQRSLMAAMGIDQWIPRSDVQTRLYQNNLYRDIASLEQTSVIQFDLAQNLSQENQTIQQRAETHVTKVEKANISPQAEVSSLKNNIQITQQNETSVSEQILQKANFQTEPSVQLESFEIQAFCIASCVILVNCTQLTADQLKLWLNIQHAIVGQYYELKWPFPILQLQDGKGANIYIQGFIDALKNERQVISLGQLPHVQAADIIQLASLQEMIDQPVLKHRLWQFMQNRVN
ncbi:MAG: hypothetical protein RR771_10225 [Acinetobacter sp.]